MKEKIYKIKKSVIGPTKNKETEIEGTLEYLTDYFSYTLEVGNSYNQKINKNPSTIKSLISNLNKSYNIKEGSCYTRTYIELISSERKIISENTNSIEMS